MSLRFHLGAHHPGWLWKPEADFPLFVSHRQLRLCKTLKPATHGWALDSGGFTELSTYGEWQTRPAEYVRATARYDREIGRLEWAAPQDHMCEPAIIHGGIVSGRKFPGTHLSVGEHQRRTVENYLLLRELWPAESDAECPYVPVLQGWEHDDYFRCTGLYAAAGVRLEDCPVVGLGSVCRRQGTGEIASLVKALTPWLALHGFGVKTKGLLATGDRLTSADSLAWSYDARRTVPMPGHAHKSCANCVIYATAWRSRLLDSLAASRKRGIQDDLFAPMAGAA
jgi:hypothetical protein